MVKTTTMMARMIKRMMMRMMMMMSTTIKNRLTIAENNQTNSSAKDSITYQICLALCKVELFPVVLKVE